VKCHEVESKSCEEPAKPKCKPAPVATTKKVKGPVATTKKVIGPVPTTKKVIVPVPTTIKAGLYNYIGCAEISSLPEDDFGNFETNWTECFEICAGKGSFAAVGIIPDTKECICQVDKPEADKTGARCNFDKCDDTYTKCGGEDEEGGVFGGFFDMEKRQ